MSAAYRTSPGNNFSVPVAHCCTRSFPIGLLQQCPVWTPCSPHPASPICPERSGSANFQNSTVGTHYSSAHQPPLAARPRMYLLQTGTYDVSIHPRDLSVLPTVMFHPRFRHDIQTTAAIFYLRSSGRSARSSLYSGQAGVSGFWCHRLEHPASPHRICAVTHGLHPLNDLRPFCFPVPTII